MTVIRAFFFFHTFCRRDLDSRPVSRKRLVIEKVQISDCGPHLKAQLYRVNYHPCKRARLDCEVDKNRPRDEELFMRVEIKEDF
jgi:hypothetical protein